MATLSFTGMSHVELHVSDLDASAAWYEAAVGLTHLRTEPGKFAILQPAGGGFRVALTTGRAADAHGELGHLALAVQSLEVLQAWAQHLNQVGVPHQGIRENKAGYSLDLFDPDGHEIELTFEH
jgi:catechol-2,3-dioxygenase